MASIKTGIELNDEFSQVIYSIINAVNMAVSSMENMQRTMSTSVDTSGLESVHDEVNSATIALDELMNQIHAANDAVISPQIDIPDMPVINTDQPSTITAPQIEQPSTVPTAVQPNAPPEAVTVPLEWDVQDIPVFTGTGVERYQQEVAAANEQLHQLIDTQNQIETSAQSSSILPDGALQDITQMSSRIHALSDQINQISTINMGDEASNQVEQLRGQLNQAIRAQEDLNDAMSSGDASQVIDAYNRLNSTVSTTERYIRDNTDEQGRFNDEIQAGTQQADQLTSMIMRAAGAYLSVQSIGKAMDISDELISTQARLSQMNDGLQSTDELVKMVYASAQDARGSFGDMASIVARFGNNVKDAFSSSEEVVQFANLIQKQMTIAGASTDEASNAMLQLSQALGSGVLRGDELNSIFEQAPNLIQSIADYLDVPIGQIRSMASEGQLTADTVKAAIFASADDINAKFDEMPMTWGQIWQSMQNTALMAFEPVLQRINEIGSSDAFQGFVGGSTQALAIVANQVLNIFDLVASVGQFISDNWSIIEPIVIGAAVALAIYTAALVAYNTVQATTHGLEVLHAASAMLAAGATIAQTAAQYGLNAALAACPITWIVLAIIALIAVIFAVCSAIARMTGVAQSGFGVITGSVMVVIAFFKQLFSAVGTIFSAIAAGAVALGHNMIAAFHNSIASIKSVFYSLLSTAMSVISKIASALSALPFVEFDASGLAGMASDYASKAQEANDSKMEYEDVGAAFQSKMADMTAFSGNWASDAFKSGAAWGDGVADKIANFDLSSVLGATDIPALDNFNMSNAVADGIGASGVPDTSGSTAGNTSKMADALSKSSEDLKYLRDIAEQETINRYTMASVHVDMSGMTNHIDNGMDIDGVVDGLTDAVDEAIENMTEGVHD